MKLVLLLMIGIVYSVFFVTSQSFNVITDNVTNVTESSLVTCAPEPTCPQVDECTCPPVTECSKTEHTRTRHRSRTDTGRMRTRTNETNGHTHSGRIGPGMSKTHRHHRTRSRTHTYGPDGRKHKTRPIQDCTPRLPPGCEEYVTTTAPVTFTRSTANTTTPLPRPSPNVCLSSVIDATGKREIPMIALQFHISENDPFTFANEASDFAEIISLLASESVGVDTVNAAVLGISVIENELSVVVAVSFNVTANRDYTLSASQIVDAIYQHLDQLEEYYRVTDMRTVRMAAQNYSPLTASLKPQSNLSASTIATIFLSVLAFIGILSTFVILTMKLSRFSQNSNESCPLLEYQDEERSSRVTWSKKSDVVNF